MFSERHNCSLIEYSIHCYPLLFSLDIHLVHKVYCLSSDCNSSLLFVIGITPLYFYIYCKFYYAHDFEIYQDIIVNISIILHFNLK